MKRSRRLYTGIAAVGLSAALSLLSGAALAKPRRPRPRPPAPVVTPPPHAPPSTLTSVDVTVVEIAGGQAYLQPGASGGVHRGAKVAINHREYEVAQSTASYAVIDFGRDELHEQERGQAQVIGEETGKVVELPKPEPPATWSHAWPVALAPAKAQTPRFVPLGGVERDRRWDVRLSAGVGALLPFGQQGAGIARTEINARVHAEPFAAPVAFDLDVSLQRWVAADLGSRAGEQGRPVIYLRQLLASYRGAGGYAGLGRMRYAASTLGTLDGLRVSAPVGSGLSVGAFGGLLPDPLSGAPSVDAQRFGIEATYSRPDLETRPEAALVVHGSTYGGSIDEKRISGVLALYPGHSRLGAHVEMSSFDASNPWKAKAIELTAAGFDASVRSGVFQFGGRFDLRQPERSRWLASFLPSSWFCRTIPASPTAPAGPEPCDGSVSTRAFGAIDMGVQIDRVSVVVGASTTGDVSQTGGAPHIVGAFATGRVVRIAKIFRIDAGANYSAATYLNMLGGSLGPGVSLFGDQLDLSVYYRNATLQYRSDHTSLVQHGVGGTAMIFPSSAVLFTLQAEAIAGDDAKALLVFATAMWRPQL